MKGSQEIHQTLRLVPGQSRHKMLPSFQKGLLDSGTLGDCGLNLIASLLLTQESHTDLLGFQKVTPSYFMQSRPSHPNSSTCPAFLSSNLCHTSMITFKLFHIGIHLFIFLVACEILKFQLLCSVYAAFVIGQFRYFLEDRGLRAISLSSAFSTWMVEMKMLCLIGAQITI